VRGSVGAGVLEEQDGDAAGAAVEEDAPAALLEATVEDFVEGVEVGGGEGLVSEGASRSYSSISISLLRRSCRARSLRCRSSSHSSVRITYNRVRALDMPT